MPNRSPGPSWRSSPSAIRCFLIVAALTLAMFASACEATTTVGVDVAADGSGVVTVSANLDRQAAQRLPDLDQSLLVKDLRVAGWKVTGPRRVPGAGWQVSASKPFRDSSELGSVVAQIAGRDGAFRDFKLDREHHFAKTVYKVEGTIDLDGGIEAFGDARLRALLGGNMFGRPEAQLAKELGGSPADTIHFRLVTHLPGGATKTWSPRLGDQATLVSASSSVRKPVAWLFAFTALLAGAGFVATVVLIARYNRIKAPPSFVHRPGGPRRPWEDS